MTGRRATLTELPFWPRLLGREEAARYVGVSPSVFDDEVARGIWPPALRRGPREGRVTWDRLALDRAADRASGLDEPQVGPDPRQAAIDAARVAAHAASARYVDTPPKKWVGPIKRAKNPAKTHIQEH